MRTEATITEAALRYAEKGYPVIPIHTATDGRCSCGDSECKSPGKHPRTSHGLKDASTDAEVIEAWFTRWPESNVAVLTDGLLVVDVDPGANGWATPDEHHQLAGASIQRTPRGGKHLVFRADAPYRCSTSKLAPHIDIRADGGYIVVEPSVVNGKPYKWEVPLEMPQELPEPPRWLREAVRRASKSKPSERHAADPEGNGEAWGAGCRNDRLTALAGRLRRAGLSADAIEAALQVANRERCQPPLGEGEVSSIAKSVGRYERGKDPGDGSTSIEYGFRTAADLAADEIKFDWLVDYVLADKQPAVLAGPKKPLKTSIALDLSISLATAGLFLGRFRVPHARRVGFMSGESGAATLQETLVRICDAANIDPAGLTNLLIAERLPQIGHLEHVDAMNAAIADHELEVCIVDPAYMAMSAAADNMSNLFKVGDSLRMLNSLTDQTGCTFVLLHHAKKTGPGNDQFAPPELEQVAWSGFQEWARQWMLLGRRRAYEPGTGMHDLWLSIGGSAGHGSGWGLTIDEGTRAEGQSRHWGVELTPAAEVIDAREQAKANRADVKAAQEHEAACRALVEKAVALNRPFERMDLLNLTRGRHARKIAAWAELVEQGTFRECGTIKKGNNQTYPTYQVDTSTDDL